MKDAEDLFYLSQVASWAKIYADAVLKRMPIAYEDLEHFLRLPLSGEALLTREMSAEDFDSFAATLTTAIRAEIKKSHSGTGSDRGAEF